MSYANTTLGELISLFYDEFMAIYGDEELAAVATAATINSMMIEKQARQRGDPKRAFEADAA